MDVSAWHPPSSAAPMRYPLRSTGFVRRYGSAVLVVAAFLGLRLMLAPVLDTEAPFLLFVVAVLVTAHNGGLGPGLLATALSALAGSYFFLAPKGELVPASGTHWFHLALFVALGVTMTGISGGLLRARARARDRRQQLSASEERFRLLVEGIQDYAIYMLDEKGRIVLWNTGAERLKGYTVREALGLSIEAFYLAEDVARGLPGWHLQQAIDRGRIQIEGWRLRKDGSRFWANVLLTALRDGEGRLCGFAKITRDVTERKRAEDEVRRLTESLELRVIERTAQLEEANRALQAFAYSVSHDLRAPLRGIQGFAEALLEDYGERLDGTGHEYARRIAAAAGRMDQLIQDILTYSRMSGTEVELQPVDLTAAVEEARETVEEEAGARGAIRVAGPLPAVRAHRPTLVQVLVNLLGNAVKFVAPGVTPRVRVSAATVGLEKGGRVRLCVDDNGIGIPAADHERIFEVFERLHGLESYPGTGVGLAMVRKSMERMGGTVGLESEPGRGSRFWIELPQAMPDPPATV